MEYVEHGKQCAVVMLVTFWRYHHLRLILPTELPVASWKESSLGWFLRYHYLRHQHAHWKRYGQTKLLFFDDNVFKLSQWRGLYGPYWLWSLSIHHPMIRGIDNLPGQYGCLSVSGSHWFLYSILQVKFLPIFDQNKNVYNWRVGHKKSKSNFYSSHFYSWSATFRTSRLPLAHDQN